MDELVGKLATKAGIDSVVAEKTVGISVDFLRREDTSENVRAQIAVGTRLMGLGIGIRKIQSGAREFVRFGQDKIGAAQMSAIIAGTPGTSRFA
jgi:hypothetical protein